MSDPTKAVLKVGGGRGFVVKLGRRDRPLVLTAAHCLPFIPPPHLASYLAERTSKICLVRSRIRRQCGLNVYSLTRFSTSPSSNSPDNQGLYEQAEAFEELIAATKPLRIADAPRQERHRVGQIRDIRTPGHVLGRVLSLKGTWIECAITRRAALLSIDPPDVIVGGMSGSPVISPEGRAIGLISTDNWCPVLKDCLPARVMHFFSTIDPDALDKLSQLSSSQTGVAPLREKAQMLVTLSPDEAR